MATSSLPSKTGLGALVSKSTILGMLGITTLGTATLFGRSPASQYYMAGSAISAAAFFGVHKWMVQEDRLPALLFQTTASHGNTPMQHLRLLNNAPPSMSIHSSNPMFVHTSAS